MGWVILSTGGHCRDLDCHVIRLAIGHSRWRSESNFLGLGGRPFYNSVRSPLCLVYSQSFFKSSWKPSERTQAPATMPPGQSPVVEPGRLGFRWTSNARDEHGLTPLHMAAIEETAEGSAESRVTVNSVRQTSWPPNRSQTASIAWSWKSRLGSKCSFIAN